MNGAHAELEVQFPNQLRRWWDVVAIFYRKPAPLRGASAEKIIALVREMLDK